MRSHLLVFQARKYLEPRVPHLRVIARRRAAARIIEYVRGTLQVGRLQTRLFEMCACVRFIQRSWKDLKAVRTEQRALIFSQVLAYESRLTATNRRYLPLSDGFLRLYHSEVYLSPSVVEQVASWEHSVRCCRRLKSKQSSAANTNKRSSTSKAKGRVPNHKPVVDKRSVPASSSTPASTPSSGKRRMLPKLSVLKGQIDTSGTKLGSLTACMPEEYKVGLRFLSCVAHRVEQWWFTAGLER